MNARHTLLLLALTGCPYVGADTYQETVRDADGDGVVGERFGGPDCQDDNPAVGDCDADRDGFRSLQAGGDDCDDQLASVHPGAEEACDRIDNDCDGAIDNDDPDAVPNRELWADADGDGEGDPNRRVVCQDYDPANPEVGLHVGNERDCDDGDSAVHTGAPEACDTIDNNCDGVIDDVGQWPRDADGDGFGQTGVLVVGACDIANAVGVAAVGGDCDDMNPDVHPDAAEVPYDGLDSNCNGGRDDWDVDFDGYVAADHFAAASAANDLLPETDRWPLQQGDCDDQDPRRNVGAVEICDGVDNDCDGATDSADLAQAGPSDEALLRSQVTLVYLDLDLDGHGGTETLLCPIAVDPALHFTSSTDCFDALPAPAGLENAEPESIHNEVEEACDGFDNNCDGRIDWDDDVFAGSTTFYTDGDADGYGVQERQACSSGQGLAALPGDCDDADSGRFPGAPEICGNAVREDCVTERCEDGVCEPVSAFDCDLDGVEGSYIGGGSGDDCNDEAAAAFPGNPEICDGLDNDCNGAVDADDAHVDQSNLPDWYVDADADGYGDPTIAPINQCNQPDVSYTLTGGDCDDTDALSNPGAPWYLDRDGDGAGVAGTLLITGSCASPQPVAGAMWVRLAGDCNDANNAFGPNTLWFRDGDDDGVGDPSQAETFCTPPAGENWALASSGEDCDDGDSTVQGTNTYYFDADSDGFGDPSLSDAACAPRTVEWVLAGTDCDDSDSGINPGKVELCNTIDDDCDGAVDDDDDTLVVLGGGPVGYLDQDDDGFGAPATARTFCTAVPVDGWSANDADCDDTTDTVNPAQVEICGNAIDDDCDGSEQIPTWFSDADGDGFGVRDPLVAPLQQCDPPAGAFTSREGDCNDSDALSFPGAGERDACDGLDDDCDGQSEPALSWTFDRDADGYGDPATAVRLCAPPTDPPVGATSGAWLLQSGDCDDTDASITFGRLYYRDADADGIGNAASPQFACPPADPNGVVLLVDLDGDGEYDASDDVLGASEPGDCFDDTALVGGMRTFYVDADGDGWGSLRESPSFACPQADGTARPGFTTKVGDCVDTPEELHPSGDPVDPALIYPTAIEILTDGQDNDCDGFFDDDNASITWFVDDDGDGFGASVATAYGPNTVTIGGDCDDANVSRHPAHPEICDGIPDNDCNASTADPELDIDLDGFSTCQGDPDDRDEFTGPDQLAWYFDEDGDGYGAGPAVPHPTRPSTDYVLIPGDCNDNADIVNPAAIDDTCDGIDDNCNGVVDEAAAQTLWYVDADADGQGAGPALASCFQPLNTVGTDTDCDDTDANVFLGGTEVCNGIDDDCDGSADSDEIDLDHDGWLACEECDDANGARNPGQPESCDNILDNDCDAGTPDPELDGDADGYSICQGDPDDTDALIVPSQLAWYLDSDDDGFGGPIVQFAAASPGPAWTASFGDCDDTVDTIFPGAPDTGLCDDIDDNCDGVPDDGVLDTAKTAYFPDTDEDGEGSDTATGVLACIAPVGFVVGQGDCDDNDPAVNTDAIEACDGFDNDCDGVLFMGEDTDADGDLARACNDCDDNDADRFPGNPEVCDGTVDNDCANPTVDIELDGDLDSYSICQGDPNDQDATLTPPLFLWFVDVDGDGFGQGTGILHANRPSPDHVVVSGDCNDTASTIFPGAPDLVCGVDANCNGIEADDSLALQSWYLDADNDGHGRLTASVASCTAPAGFVSASDDCNDADDQTHPGAMELCDGRDNDCTNGIPADELEDDDVDGHPVCDDCDDTESLRYNGAPEVCDGVLDNDCGMEMISGFPDDLEVDNDLDGASECQGDPDDTTGSIQAPSIAWFTDVDLDGFGGGSPVFAPVAPSTMHTQLGGDCDDTNVAIYPGAVDSTCDGIDQDCSGADANNASMGTVPEWFLDADEDGQGRPTTSVIACVSPVGYVSGPGTDCDDLDPNVFLGAPVELCDGKDTNCDGLLPGNETTDADLDGFYACEDCQDDEPRRYPGHPEVCDGILDNNCVADGEIETDDDLDGASECEGDANDDDANVGPPVLAWYLDSDHDGYGDGPATNRVSPPSANHVLITGDCNDLDATVYPGAFDLCNGIDSDCSGVVGDDDTDRLAYHLDADEDGRGRATGTALLACTQPPGYVSNTNDCNDLDPTVYVGAPELCDGKDTACTGNGVPTDEFTDGDGDGYMLCEDCDDSSAFRNAGYPEICDGVVDNDCGMEMNGALPDDLEIDNDFDGASECEGDPDDDDALSTAPLLAWYLDQDGDGFGGPAPTYNAVSPGTNYVRVSGDCMDSAPLINPAATDDDCDNIDDDCDGQADQDSPAGLTPYHADADGDFYGDPSVTALFCTVPTSGWTSDNTDCDDTDGTIHPNAPETCDGIDSDCDFTTEHDDDGDGFYECDDCDDNDANTYPGAEELCDEVDNNCDGGFIDLGGYIVWDVPNPYTGTGVDVYGLPNGPSFGDAPFLLGDTDHDAIPSILNIEEMCDDFYGASVVTVLYANPSHSYDLYTLDFDQDLVPQFAAANDCDTGEADDPLNLGTVVFADTDSDGYPGATSRSQVAMTGCGQPAPANFIPYSPVLGSDCAPVDSGRHYLLQEGDYPDLDNDGFASSRPLTVNDIQELDDYNERCVEPYVSTLSKGIDCDDRYGDTDPTLGHTLTIETGDQLDDAFANCSSVTLDVTHGVVWGGVHPRPDANLTIRSSSNGCTLYNSDDCIDLDGNTLMMQGTNFPHITARNGFTNGTIAVPSSGTLVLKSVSLNNVQIQSEGNVELDDVQMVVPFGASGITVDTNATLTVVDSTFTGSSSGTAIDSNNVMLDIVGTDFTSLDYGIRIANGQNVRCEDCGFTEVETGMQAETGSTDTSDLLCSNCLFDDVTVGMKAVGGTSAAHCVDCTITKQFYPHVGSLIDNTHATLVAGAATAENVYSYGISQVPLVNAAGGNAELSNVFAEQRPLFLGSGAARLVDIEGIDVMNGPFIDYPSDGTATLEVIGLEVAETAEDVIAGSGTMRLRDLNVHNVATVLRSTSALDVRLSDVTIDGAAGIVLNLTGYTNQAHIQDVRANDLTGSLFALDNGVALLEDLEVERASQWMSLGAGADVSVFDSSYTDSDASASDIHVNAGHLYMSGVRMIDVDTDTGATPSRDVVQVQGFGTFSMESSLIWSTGPGYSILTNAGAIDLRHTTLYSGATNGMIHHDNGSDDHQLENVLFYDLTPDECAVQGGTTPSLSTDNWFRDPDQVSGCPLTVNPTFEVLPANFNAFTRLPSNSAVRNGWGELSD